MFIERVCRIWGLISQNIVDTGCFVVVSVCFDRQQSENEEIAAHDRQ